MGSDEKWSYYKFPDRGYSYSYPTYNPLKLPMNLQVVAAVHWVGKGNTYVQDMWELGEVSLLENLTPAPVQG